MIYKSHIQGFMGVLGKELPVLLEHANYDDRPDRPKSLKQDFVRMSLHAIKYKIEEILAADRKEENLRKRNEKDV